MALLALAATGCKEPSQPQSGTPPQPPPAAESAEPEPPPRREPMEAPAPVPAPPPARSDARLLVYCAPSLGNAVEELGRRYQQSTGVEIVVSRVAVHDALRRFSSDGGDVLVAEGYTALDVARATQLVEDADVRTVTHLPLTVTVGWPRVETIRSLRDLASPPARVGLPDPAKSTGARAARRLLARANLVSQVRERVIPAGVASALDDGTIDAYIGWGRLGSAGKALILPAALRENLPVPAAVFRLSKQADAARAFLEWLASDNTEEVWVAAGTTPTLADGSPILPTLLPIKLPQPRQQAGSAVVGERMLLAGGEAGGALLNTLTWLDPIRVRAWDASTRLAIAAAGAAVEHAAGRGQVIIAGGRTADGPTMAVHRFHPANEVVDPSIMSLPLPLADAASAVLESRMFLVGGRGTRDVLLDTIVRLDLATGQTTRLTARLPSPRAEVAAAPAPGDRIWLLGGAGEQHPLDEILEFDPATGALEKIEHTLSKAVAAPTVLRWRGGYLIAGGRGVRGPRDTVETLSDAGVMTRLPHRLPYPVARATAARLHEQVFIVGGLSDERVEARIVRFPH